MKWSKRALALASFLLIGFGFSFLASTFSAPVQAQGVDKPSDYEITESEFNDYWKATEDCSTPSLECLVRNVSRFTAIEMSFDIVGKDDNNKLCIIDHTCEGALPTKSNLANRGAIGSLGDMITAMYAHPVADTNTYIADVLDSAHIVTPAYAQGLGFASLNPVLNLWKTFRNISYMFFVLIFVVVGFLIMFRQKVGQTAITAQQAIPQIIMSLVLVTFSYAIAGFMIDLMYVLMVLIVGVFSSYFPQDIFGYNILELAGKLFHGAVSPDRNKDFISGFLQNLDIGGSANQIVSMISGLTLTLVLAIAMLIGVIRLFFEMLKSYATIIISVVMAPLLLMIGAIPGRSSTFGTWIKTLVGNLSPFPVVLAVLVMYYAFTNGAIDASSGGFMPPFLLSAGSGIGDSIIALMSLAIILALPDIVKNIKDTIAPKNSFAELVTGSAAKNIAKGLDYAENSIPAWTGAGQAGLTMAQKYRGARKRGGLSRGRAFRSAIDTNIEPVEYGGVKYNGWRAGFGSGMNKGMSIRRTIDRVRTRRLFDPEDQEKLLRQLVEGKKDGAKGNTSDEQRLNAAEAVETEPSATQ
ncbi:ABC transporter ATP-binding protein [Candidatus Woesebacteria bacterium]|nr:ABC transporter ATP-binding protein [Candidatus Woesebacteria bacterium]